MEEAFLLLLALYRFFSGERCQGVLILQSKIFD
jgi:hypothetical protein